LVVWRLDRLGRSVRHLVEVVTGLEDRGVGFRSPVSSPRPSWRRGRALHAAGDRSMQQIADAVGVGRATLYRHMQAAATGED
jgi:DNA invertase Pin-like site-specific DNA recombinase